MIFVLCKTQTRAPGYDLQLYEMFGMKPQTLGNLPGSKALWQTRNSDSVFMKVHAKFWEPGGQRGGEKKKKKAGGASLSNFCAITWYVQSIWSAWLSPASRFGLMQCVTRAEASAPKSVNFPGAQSQITVWDLNSTARPPSNRLKWNS